MRNIKFISIFAACGFIMSFVFGLFSHSSFISIFLKALIFGACFVGLGFLVSFIFDRFLLDSDSLMLDENDGGDNGFNNGDNVSVGTNQQLDVVDRDEELQQSDSDNHFLVGDNHQMLKKSDIKEDSINNDFEGNNNVGFVPLRNSENAENFSGEEAVSSADVGNNQQDNNGHFEEDLDTLPDMENLVLSNNEYSENTDDNSYIDSGFVPSANTFSKKDVPAPEIKNASLIAKAISTALAEDN